MTDVYSICTQVYIYTTDVHACSPKWAPTSNKYMNYIRILETMYYLALKIALFLQKLTVINLSW
jgi:hypothetical protein